MSDPVKNQHPLTDHPDHMPEGEEHPPAGVRTMAIVRWALVGLMAVAAVGAWVSYTGVLHGHEEGAAGQRYQCPMHPTIIMDHPAECPICGMDLVPIAETKAAPAAEAAPAENGGLGPIAEDPFLCPMHLHVGGPDNKVRCPECGMNLWPREKAIDWAKSELAKKQAASQEKHSGVPGLVPVELAPDRVQLIGVRTAEVGRAKLAPELRAVGQVVANEAKVSMVHTRFAGWIEELAAPETGQLVKKGQVLARIYSPDLLTAQEEYLSALRWAREGGESARSLAEAARRRLQLLGVSRADIDAIAKRGAAQHALEIRAPVSGHVVEKAAVEGLYVDPGTHLFTVADLSNVWVLADVYERDVARIRVGQPARLRLAAFPRETFEGKVEFVYPTLDTQTRTLRVRLAFPNPELKLRPGMFGDAFLALDAAEGLVVPREALVDTGDHQYVFVAQGEGRFAPRAVRTGSRGEDTVEILEGVEAGERVVTTANFLIDSESRLRAAIQGTGTPASGTGAAPATSSEAAPPAPAAPHAGHQH